MAMMEVPMMMGQGTFGPGAIGPGKGSNGHGYDSGRVGGAFEGSYFNKKKLTADERVDALTSDVRTEINELIRDRKIEKIPFKSGKGEVTDPRTGEKKIMDTVYFPQYGGRTLPDVTNIKEENGGVRERVIKNSGLIAETTGEVAWISQGESEDRFYLASRDGNGDGSLYSIKLKRYGENTLWNLLDRLDGKKHDRNRESLEDITIVRDRRREKRGLDIKEVADAYTRSLSPSAVIALAPFVKQLNDEALIPENIRDREIAAQEKLVKQEVKRLLGSYDTRHALGVVGQSLAAWARQFEEMIPQEDRSLIAKPRMQRYLTNSTLFISDYYEKRLKKRLWKEHSGGRRFRKWRRLAEKRLAGMVIVPRKSKLYADKVGEVLLEGMKQRGKSVFHNEGKTYPSYIDRRIQKGENSLIRSEESIEKQSLVVKEHIMPVGSGSVYLSKDLRRKQKNVQSEIVESVQERPKQRDEKKKLETKGKRISIRKEALTKRGYEQKQPMKTKEGKIERIKKEHTQRRVELKSEQNREKRKDKEMKKLRTILRIINKIEGLLKTERAKKIEGKRGIILSSERKIILKLARKIWGKESAIYKKLKKERDITILMKIFKRKSLDRLERLTINNRKEKRWLKKLKIKIIEGKILLKKYAKEGNNELKKRRLYEGKRRIRRKILFDLGKVRRKRISVFAESPRLRKIKINKKENRNGSHLLFNGNRGTNGQSKLLLRRNIIRERGDISYISPEILRNTNKGYILGKGKTNKQKRRNLPKFGIIYEYKKFGQIAYIYL